MYRQASLILAVTAIIGAALAAALLAGCAGLPRGAAPETKIEAEGWAPADARAPEAARGRALADAQRRAVERVCGVSLSALTRIDDAVVRREKLIAEVRGFVSRYELLGEESDGEFLKVRIRAWIRRDAPFENDAPIAPEARLSVAVSGRGANDEDWAGSAAAEIRRELAARGFALTAGSAPVSLQGEVGAAPIMDPRLGAFHSSSARIRLQAVDTRTGTVVWEKTQDAAALDLDPAAASIKAAAAAGALLGRQAAAELAEVLWKRL